MTTPPDPAALNVTSMINGDALRPTTMVHIVAGPHRGKHGRIKSSSGDGHVLVDAAGEAKPIRVHADHVVKATDPGDPTDPSAAADTALRAMAAKARTTSYRSGQ